MEKCIKCGVEYKNGAPHKCAPLVTNSCNWPEDDCTCGKCTSVVKGVNPDEDGPPVVRTTVFPAIGDGKTTDIGLPTDAAKRKATPIFSGVLRYFPDALAAVAELSRIGNEQHNPGEPLHWARSKSGDEWDALTRHLLEVGTFDTDGVRHAAKVAWRGLAGLQKEIELAADVDLSDQD